MVSDVEVFEFLTEVRNSGKHNMFGVAPMLVEKFGFELPAARHMLLKYMDRKAWDKIENAEAERVAKIDKILAELDEHFSVVENKVDKFLNGRTDFSPEIEGEELK